MINLYFNYTSFGPGKVVKNLILGLEKISYPFRLNPETSIVDFENDNFLCLQDVPFLNDSKPKKLIIGPNICVLPIDNRTVMSQDYKLHLVPCKWVYDYFSTWINPEKLSIWPVGIDCDQFKPFDGIPKKDCLVYFKRRSEMDLVRVTKLLKSKNQTFEILRYGDYTEKEFLIALSKVRYVFLVNGSESQGIAVQEIMACNKPIFCWDITAWTDRGDKFIYPATSTPYWDEKIGLKTASEPLLEFLFNQFLERLLTFEPRKYILENLTLESQARNLIEKF